jgi:hypothetical protein
MAVPQGHASKWTISVVRPHMFYLQCFKSNEKKLPRMVAYRENGGKLRFRESQL